MNDRQKQILNILINSSLPTPISELTHCFQVSVRTIKYDLSEIKNELAQQKIELLNKKNKGYFIPVEAKNKLLNPQNKKESNNQLIDKLIVTLALSDEKMTLLKLSNHFFYSESTIRNIVREIPFIEITQQGQIHFTLSEYNLRNKLVEIIQNNPELAQINEDFNSNLHQLIKQYHGWISSIAMSKISHYLYLTLCRFKRHPITQSEAINSQFNAELEMSEKILNRYGITSQNEINGFTLYCISQGLFFENQELNEELNKNLIAILQKLDADKFNLNQLLSDLTQHLSQYFKKVTNGYKEEPNPLLQQIKENYSQYFQQASSIASDLEKEYTIHFDQSEISYIAIYLYKNRLEKVVKLTKVITVCGTGRGLSLLLKTRLENVFKNIEVIDSVSSHYLLNKNKLKQADLIVSTIKLPPLEKDVIYVSAFLGRQDMKTLSNYFEFGKMAETIPFPEEKTISETGNSHIATQFSQIFLKLYDCIMKLPSDLKISQEAILGMTIHLIIAFPRWLETSTGDDEEIVTVVNQLETDHKEMAKIMNEFFAYAEKKFSFNLNVSERYAFYQYLLMESKHE